MRAASGVLAKMISMPLAKWYCTTTDIEDRKRAELLRGELAHVNRITTMGELLASISHELKQPITASVLNARTALRWLKHDPPNVNEASEITNKSSSPASVPVKS
jgi:C4-dicarboxylate-specific signal transduction histidine kinase